MATFFISHSSRDRESVDELAHRLRAWGYGSLFLDFDPEDGLVVGQRWERELYRQVRLADAVLFVASRASAKSRWCFGELTLARSGQKPVFPLRIERGVELPLLDDRQWLDLTSGEPAFQRLRRALHERFDPHDTFAWDLSRAPFPGLMSFQRQDAAVFFARDDIVTRLVGLLDADLGRGRCVAVIGASGSGKSSVVRAGLMPRLERSRDRWVLIPPMIPGERPMSALARALAAALRASGFDIEREELEARLGRNAGEFIELLGDLVDRGNGGQRCVLLVVDQLEEVVLLADAPSRERFLEVLRLAMRADLPLWVVVTLRSEYLSASLRDETLLALIQETVLLGPLGRSRMAEVILGPARRAGLEFTPGLVERMIEDTPTGDALPLLAYTLRELYDRRANDGTVLSGSDYDAMGGVDGALQRRADLVRHDLDVRGHGEHVLPTLLRLVTVHSEGEPARQPLLLSELNESEHDIVQAFIDAHLLVSAQRGDEAVVEIAHEALLRVWKPLVEAISNERSLEGLRRRADQVAHDLYLRGYRELMQLTLLRFVTMDVYGEPLRRRVWWSELDQDQRDIVQAFIDARLLVSTQRGDDTDVEIFHEALIWVWPPLRVAIESRRALLGVLAELERNARDWHQYGRADSYLLRDDRLADVRKMISLKEARDLHLTKESREFYLASEALNHRRRRQRLALLTALIVLICAAFLVGLVLAMNLGLGS